MSGPFTLLGRAPGSRARRGRLRTAHGVIETPNFMPVGTYGTLRGVPSHLLPDLGAQVMLVNFLHLFFYPGPEALERAGGVHRFFSIPVPVLADSGGYQVFSLGSHQKVREEGVLFQDPRSGRKELFTPEKVARFEEAMGMDIGMVLDVCLPHDAGRRAHERAVAVTHRWAERALGEAARERMLQFGICQGGTFPDLRLRSAQGLSGLPFDGYGVGGLGIGEDPERTFDALEASLDGLPENKPRYFMGMGYPEDIARAVDMGVDLFDCVLPTRNARNGQLFTSRGVLNFKRSPFREMDEPPDPACPCPVCRHYSLAYLHAMFRQKEMTAAVLATVHNVAYYLDFLGKIRENIASI
jgi:queuine tRNA-ribosyltransferase